MTETDKAAVNRGMAKGVAWSLGLRFAIRSIGFVSILILARILTPDAFGLVALATTVVAMFEFMTEFGFAVYLIQNQDADREYYDTAWTMGLIRNAVVASGVLGCASYAAMFFDDARLESVLHVLAASFLVYGLVNVKVVDFRKKLNFRREFVFMATARVISFLVTISLAFVLRTYWALILGIAANQIIRVVLSYVMLSYRPRFALSKWRPIFNFSKWVLLNGFGQFAYAKSDTFLIGRLLDSASLGFYTIALQVSNIAAGELGGPIRRAILPGYAKLSKDAGVLRETALDVFGLTTLVMVPISIGVLVCAEPLVLVLVGSQWIPSIPLVEVLAIAGLVRALNPSIAQLFFATGRPKMVTLSLFSSLAVMLPLMYFLTMRMGTEGAAWAIVVGAAVRQLALLYLARQQFGITATDCARRLWRTAIAVLVMAVAMQWVDSATGIDVPLMRLAVIGLTGLTCLVATQWLVWRVAGCPDGAESSALKLIAQMLARVRR